MRLLPALLLSLPLLFACSHLPAKKAAKTFPWDLPANSWFLARIPPPPAAGSAEARRDLATVLDLQAAATPGKIAQAQRTYDLTVFTFAPAIGPRFSAQNFPLTAEFFLELNNLVGNVNDYVKDAYKRPHPFQVSDKVRRFVIAKPGYSYPSYHSARCVVFQHVLDELDPGHNTALTRISREVEEDRVFAGEHFPSDITGGIRLGELIWAELEKNGNFRAAVEHLKAAEWTPPPGTR